MAAKPKDTKMKALKESSDKAVKAKAKNSMGLKKLPKESKSLAGKVGAVAGKVAKRAKTVAREARDIPTAVSTAVSGRNVGYGGAKFAKKDLKTQIKEVGSAIKSGRKGTAAAEVRAGARKKGTIGAGGLDQNVSKMKAKRK